VGITRQKCVLVVLDAILLTIAYLGAFFLRLSAEQFAQHYSTIFGTLPVIIGISLIVHLRQGLFHAVLRYASVDTAFAVVRSVIWSVVISCTVIFLLFRLEGIPRSVFVIHAMAALLLVGAARLVVRIRFGNIRFGAARSARSMRAARSKASETLKPVVLYGAGDNAELVLRGVGTSADLDFEVAAIFDDDRLRTGRNLHQVPILATSRFEEFARSRKIEELWVCESNLIGEKLRELYVAASAVGVRVKILPRLTHALLGTDLGRFQQPRISDLLRRPPRSLDRDRMRKWIAGRRVLITGAGGSIGSELARQVAALGPESLALCDSCEENIFEIHGELSPSYGEILQPPYLVDVREAVSVSRMMRQARPQVVFHAAAYKHVPLVELNPCEGVLTNVQGLSNVALAAVEFEVADFVFISTDKAVRPANVMGATKRLGEKLIQVLNREEKTKFCAVRFGNVLGSSGSVVPIFQRQILQGGPVTVTHPDMTRYFMLVSEAVELVIQAGSIGSGGEVFILDMGQPVKISDMARDLIRLMGKEPETEIEIRYSGTRPGEKIHEELMIQARDFRTAFEDIWIDGEPSPALLWTEFAGELRRLFESARAGDRAGVVLRVHGLVPEFEPAFGATRESMATREIDELEIAEVASRTVTLRRRSSQLEESRTRVEAGARSSLQ